MQKNNSYLNIDSNNQENDNGANKNVTIDDDNIAPKPTQKSAGFKITFRFLIASVSGLIVAIVAAVTLAVSTTVSTETARNLGISLANALVKDARLWFGA